VILRLIEASQPLSSSEDRAVYHSDIDDGDDESYQDIIQAFFRRSLYRSVDALVQASRGEGWGRPHQEAMSMSLPVIATNWSGTMVFMTETNSFLVPVQRMETLAEGPFKGHQWAIPSVVELRKILRAAVTYPERGRDVGLQARKDIWWRRILLSM